MPDQYKEDKTEKATGKRRSQARDKGNVAQSQEVVLVIMIFGSVLGLYCFGPYMRDRMVFEFYHIFDKMNYAFTSESLRLFITDVVVDIVKILLPILSVILFLAFFSNWIQVGNLFTLEPLRPKFDKIKPKFSELNMFKLDKLVKLATSVGKLMIIIPVAYFSVAGDLEAYVTLIGKTVPELFNFICMMIFKIVTRMCLILIALAVLDYAYKRWKYEEDLKMTKQEVKDERKNMDQDPQVKGKIKSYGREIMRKLMFQEVQKADVVITNPTHIAVAIKYDPESMDAPRVVAKGARLIAEKIKSIARENNVPVVENKPLARILYKTVDVGGFIPPELYRAVAQVLAYVYKMNKKSMPGMVA